MSESQQAGEPLTQRQEQLDRHIAEKVDGLLRTLHQRLGDQVRTASEELLQWLETQEPELPSSFLGGLDLSSFIEPKQALEEAPAPPGVAEGIEKVVAAVAAIDRETGQAEILTSLIDQSLEFASNAAFILIRGGQARGWAGRGFNGDQTTSFSGDAEDAPWSQLSAAGSSLVLDREAAERFSMQLGSASVDAAVLLPFSIRGQVSGALFAGREAGASLDIPALQLLTHAAAMALETSAVSPGASPALSLTGELQSSAAAEVLAEEHIPAEMPVAGSLADESGQLVSPGEPNEQAPSASSAAEDVQGGEDPGAEVDIQPEFSGESSAEQELTPAIDEPAHIAPVTGPAGEVAPAEDPAVEARALPGLQADQESALAAGGASSVLSGPDVEGGSDGATLESEPVEAESSDYLPTEDDIALEAEPEPELEDTNIWELEEDEEEPTQVGTAASVSSGTTPGTSPEETPADDEAVAEAPPVETGPGGAAQVGQETVRIDLAKIQQDPAVSPSADPGDETSPTMHALAQESAASPPLVEPVESAQSFGERASPPSSSSEAASPSSFAAPAPAEEPAPPPSFVSPPPEPEPEKKPEPASGSTEVVPPPDLDGPGLAFATPEPAAAEKKVDEGDAALHEEARRLARLLVSEIKLYNEEIIEEGRRSGNVYERLKDDIDRSRQMYEERIDPRLADQEDYFYQELVQRLAGGDEQLLGM